MDLLTYFDRTYVVNLPERRDRRRETERELRRHFPSSTIDERVRFYPAIRPVDQGPFNCRGAHGIFLSVLDILTAASRDGLNSVLIMEDDVRFNQDYRAHVQWLNEQIAASPWDILQLGYIDQKGSTASHLPNAPILVDFDDEVLGTHCIGLRGSVIEPALEHLRTVINGQPGDDLLGPMPLDGAFNTFGWCHPEIRRVLPVPVLVDQRSSRSDINPKRHDRITPLRPLLQATRSAYTRLQDLTKR